MESRKGTQKFLMWWVSILTLLFLIFPGGVLAAPALTAITPNTGYNWGLTQIIEITGTGIEEGAQVTLARDGQPDIMLFAATVSAESITGGSIGFMGAEPGAWDVVVTNPDGQSAMLPGGFTLIAPPAPIVASNTPDLTENTGIAKVDITGENFLSGARVKLFRTGYSDVEAVFVMVESSTQISCDFDLTNVEPGHWDVVVTNPDGQTGVSHSIDIVQGQGAVVLNGTNFYVDAVNGSNTTGNGSQSSPWKTITYAMGSVSGTVVINIAPGTYNPALGETFPIRMRTGISLSGAGASNTILDAQSTNSVLYFANLGTTETVTGLTLTNGKGAGGGIFCYYASPTITNCNIVNNTTTLYSTNSSGAGISCYYSTSPTIRNCVISNNTVTDTGGSAGGINFYSCTSPILENSIISSNRSGNMSAGWMGAIQCYRSSAKVNNCIIRNNIGAGNFYMVYSAPTITNCIITGNIGGGLNISNTYYGQPIINNCIIAGNQGNGGISCGNAFATITNCTVTGNTTSTNIGAGLSANNWNVSSPVTMVNCILWGDTYNGTSKEISLSRATLNISYSDIQGGWAGTNNINQNPLFVNAAIKDYHLQSLSPCINKGTATGAPQYDFEGDPRYNNPDIGADEFIACAYTWYKDADNDGYSDGSTIVQCTRPNGYKLASELITTSGDCNDNDPSITLAQVWYKDADNDGYSDGNIIVQCIRPNGYKLDSELIAVSGDCNDNDSAITVAQVWYKDADNDGYSDGSTITQCARPTGYKLPSELNAVSGDCNDNNAAFNPVGVEYCDGADNNCNGQIDENCIPCIIYVPGNYSSIQGAINAAGNGCTIIVGDGIYAERINFNGKTITVRSEHGAANTTINGSAGGSVVTFSNSESNSSVLDGFTITNGKGAGGGIFCYYASPTITNCNIVNNTTTLYSTNSSGAGISCYYSTSPTIRNCVISNNTVTDTGGSAGGINFYSCTSPILENSIISSNRSGNMSAGWMGAIQCYRSSAKVNNCIIRNNIGAGNFYMVYSAPTITNCIITGNIGGGLNISNTYYGQPIINNCIIAGNQGNGGISCGNAFATITNCTVTGNTTSTNIGAGLSANNWNVSSPVTMVNCILWGNTYNGGSKEISLASATLNISYSDIQGGWGGTGNINADPRFVNAGDGDFHLQAGSQCINNGTLSGAPSYDFEGDPRLASVGGDNLPDMGADENPDHMPPVSAANLSGTLGNDGWYVSSVSVNISAIDDKSGGKEIHYSVDGGIEAVAAGATASFSLTTDGIHSVSYYAVDNAGNQEATNSLTVKIDTGLPTTMAVLSGTMGDNGWYLSGVNVNLSAEDTVSGIREIRYTVDGGSELIAGNPASITIATDGIHTVTYYAVDNAGNRNATGSLEVKIDQTAPTASTALAGTLGNNGWYLSGVTANLSAEDTVSGVREIRYTVDGGSELTAVGNSASISLSADGIHTVTYYAVDNAGNRNATGSLEVKIDQTTPTASAGLTGTLGNNGWYTSNVCVALTANDAGSGMKEIRYTVDGGNEVIAAGGQASVCLNMDGIYTISYYAVDNAGNNTAVSVLTIKIDKTQPVTTVNLIGTLGNNGWYVSTVTVGLSSVDNISGVSAICYSINGQSEVTTAGSVASLDLTSEGIYNIIYYAVDNAGNQEAANSLMVKIDWTAPVVNAGPDVRVIETEAVNLPVYSVHDNLDPNPAVTVAAPAVYHLGDNIVTVTAVDAAGNTGADSLVVTVITAQAGLNDLKNMINGLPDDAFKNNADNRKNALSNKLNALISIVNAAKATSNPATQDALYNEAITKLQNDVQAKMDGCPNVPDANDWINCSAQGQLNELINRILVVLNNLRNA